MKNVIPAAHLSAVFAIAFSMPVLAVEDDGSCILNPDGTCGVSVSGSRGGGGMGAGLGIGGSGGGMRGDEYLVSQGPEGPENEGQTESGDRDGSTKDPCAKGNPVLLSSGNKVEYETDFAHLDRMQHPLRLKRTYSHYWKGVGLFGKHWLSTYDYKLTFGTTEVNACYPRPGGGACGIGANTVIWAWRPDGRTVRYVKAADGVFYEERATPISRIVVDTNGEFVLYTQSGSTERYSSAGYVSQVKDAYGIAWNYSYSGTYPTRVTHTSGRYVDFTWSSGRLTAVRDPAGNYYGYAYANNAFGTGLHRLSAVSLPGAPATTVAYHYEVSGKPGALTGKSYNGIRYSWFVYSADGFAIETRHGTSIDRYSFTYTPTSLVPNGLVVEETNPLGKRAVYTFSNGRLVDFQGQASAYCPASFSENTYDANGALDLSTDPNGNITDHDHNGRGQPTQIVEAAGTALARTTQYVWDSSISRTLSEIEIGQRRIDRIYTADHRVSSITVTNLSAHGVANQARTTQYSYTKHANGLLATVTEDGPLPGNSDAIVHTFDAEGHLISIANSLGHTTTYSNYNGLGQPGRIVGPNGDTVDYVYDARGRIVIERRWYGATAADTAYAYNAQGLLASVTLPDASVTYYEYDAARRPVRVWRSANGNLGDATKEDQLYTYDAMSNVVRVENRKWVNQTQWQCTGWYQGECLDYQPVVVEVPTVVQRAYIDYDELGRVRARRGNGGQNVRYTYDDNGNLKTVVDSLNRTTTLAYDALGRLTQSQDAANGLTRFEYDAADRVVKVTDPRNLNTTYVYDGFGQLWAQHSPDTGATTFQYNASGLRTYATRNDGSGLVFGYDSIGRLTWYGTSTQGRGFSYDWCQHGKGRLCEATTGAVARHFAYSPYGQLQATRDFTAGMLTDDWTGYSYDTSGRLTGIAYPSGVNVGYGYAGGKLTTMTAMLANGSTATVASGMKYLPFGGIEHWIYGNGIQRLMTADMDGRTTAIHSDGVQGLYYTWNANDEIVKIVNGADATLTQDFGYDALSRLSTVASSSGNQNFAFDANGNRTLHNWHPSWPNEPYVMDGASNRVLSTHLNFTYDGRGNRATQSWGGSTATYTYDAFNRLKQVSRNVASTWMNPNYVTTTYPAGSTEYVVNALDQRVSKSGPLGTSRFVYAGQNTLLAEHTNGAWSSYLWLGGRPVGLVRNNTLYWIHNDHLGRPEMATNTAQQRVWWAKNYAYDRAVSVDNIGGLNLGLPGQYYDAESGHWYNGFRDYDSRLGRYLQSDPIGLRGGVSTYGYVRGNPIHSIDALGLIDLRIDGVPISIHANPGPEATNFRPEHDPPHVHLGGNDGPRVDTKDFKPLSEKDAMKMTKEQKKMCANLTDAQKNLIRARQAQVFKYGKILSIAATLPKMGMDSFTRACQTDIVFCVELIETVGPPANYGR